MTYLKSLLAVSFSAFIGACSSAPAADGPQDEFFAALKTFCGQTHTGKVTSEDEADADWRKEVLVVGPVSCEKNEIRMPLAVGANTSRTWIVTRGDSSLTLKHDHRHDDGSPDAVTNYGGTTASVGTAERQEFPVDEFSIDLFKREGLAASVTNTWAFEAMPGERLAYELSRPPVDGKRRFFRAEFDLTAK
ncbi:MAG: hypothetical protein ACPGVT_14145 [Maricaulaceae bacterium]